jgi:hypothetical protein
LCRFCLPLSVAVSIFTNTIRSLITWDAWTGPFGASNSKD